MPHNLENFEDDLWREENTVTTTKKISQLRKVTEQGKYGKDEAYQLLLSILEDLEKKNVTI